MNATPDSSATPVGRMFVVTGWIAAMGVLGALAAWGLSALAARRVGEPLAGPAPSLVNLHDHDPMERLRDGTDRAVKNAIDGFKTGRRTAAVLALDAARRAARTGRDAGAPGFAELVASIREARTAVQNGDADRAPRILAQAEAAFVASAPTGRVPPAKSEPAEALRRRLGATVINAEGVRIGKLLGVGPDAAVILLSRKGGIFGLTGVGGAHVQVPSGQLIPGRARGAGAALVALPVFGVTPEDIATEIAGG